MLQAHTSLSPQLTEAKQYFVVVEKEVLLESTDMSAALQDLIAAYFTFTIAYSRQLYSVLFFLQHHLLTEERCQKTSNQILTLDQIYSPPAPEVSSGEDVPVAVSGVRTQGFPRYNIKEETTLISLHHHLLSMDGKNKSQTVADQMAIDVPKFLKFTCGDQVVPDWRRLLDRDQIMAFMDKLERYDCGSEGRVTKLDALDAALRFFRLELLKDVPGNALHTKALQMTETIKGWKATLRKQKTGKRIQRMEEVTSEAESLLLEEVENIRCEPRWGKFTTTAERLGKRLAVSESELNRCTIMIATVLTFRSWH